MIKIDIVTMWLSTAHPWLCQRTSCIFACLWQMHSDYSVLALALPFL